MKLISKRFLSETRGRLEGAMSSTRFSEGLPGEGRKRYPTDNTGNLGFDWSRSKTVRVFSLTGA